VFAARGDEVVAAGRAEVDLSAPDAVPDAVAGYNADWVINCAAYTQVDKAEEETELAFRVNRDGARAVAEGAGKSGSRLLHLSTDFIFAGDRSSPYDEADAGAPLGVYGRSKWEGEQAVRETMPEALIVRTAWVYGAYGNNFVKTMLRLMAEREEVRVVDDQIGTPSWTADIAMAMRALIEKNSTGTWHFTNEGVASWFDVAHEAISIATQLGHASKVRRLLPIPSNAYPCAAKRPNYSVLSKEKIRQALGYEIPHWRDSLYKMLTSMPL
jgi:dTDP-4-dehydrorhamnose reductase